MNIGNGFLVKTKEEALEEIQLACKGDEVKLIPYPMVSKLMEYYMSDKGVVYGCRKHHGFYHVTPLVISKRYKRGPCFRISLASHREKTIYLANALYNTFCSNSYDDDLELEYLDGNPYNLSLPNLKRKELKVSSNYLDNLNIYSNLYKVHFNKAVSFCLWYGGENTRLDEAKDIASDSFYEMCRCDNIRFQSALNLWLHICKNRILDNNSYKKRFESIISSDGEEFLGIKPYYTDIEIWNEVKGKRNIEYLRLWATGETPTSVAEITHSSPSNVRSSISRTIQYLKNIYRNDIEIFNKSNHYGRKVYEKI